MDTTVQVRERGKIILSSDLRKKYNIKSGSAFKLVDLDGIFAFVPMAPMIPDLAHEIERARLEAGLSSEELFRDLRIQRERYNRENYYGLSTRE